MMNSLFDPETFEPTVAAEWREVPQARFLSWPPEMQAAYCAARDDDSALSAASRGEDPEWYKQRARSYRSNDK